VTTRGKNNINIWLTVIILILIGQLRNIFISKRPKSSSVFGCSVNWPGWNVTLKFRFFPKMFEISTEKVFQCRWYTCCEITKCCHSWTSIQKKGNILQIPLRQGGVHEAKKRQDLYVLNWKSSIWRHVVYVTTFGGILTCSIFRPRDMQEYYMLFGIFARDSSLYSLSVLFIAWADFQYTNVYLFCVFHAYYCAFFTRGCHGTAALQAHNTSIYDVIGYW
jgi:hypothetical protein